tara:strand:- start:542 stop:1294 length:753 start_codon:yes stop_codon:yes gene_type:complete
MKTIPRTLLIDGDIVLYEVSVACEHAVDWGDDIWTLHSDLREAKQRFDCWVADIKEKLMADSVILAFSSPNNWRKKILPSYKNNRKNKRKPLTFARLKSYAKDAYSSYEIDGLEGDDILGLLSGYPGLGRIIGEKVVVTIDKDLMTIPGFHYFPNRSEDGIIEVTVDQANYNHLLQSLTGDSVDGYSGCPGIGPKRAEAILKRGDWSEVVKEYEKKGLAEEDALIQARVARILRWGEYDFNKGEVKTWKP